MSRSARGAGLGAAPGEVGQEGQEPAGRHRRVSWYTRIALCVCGLALLFGVAVVVLFVLGRPRVVVSRAGEALVSVRTTGLGSRPGPVHASSDGRPVALQKADGGLVPVHRLAQGQAVEVRAAVDPPGWLRWLVGGTVTSTVTVRAPAAAPAASVVLAPSRSRVPVRFDAPVSTVAYRQAGGGSHVVHLAKPAAVVDLAVYGSLGGSMKVQAAPRPWERLSAQAKTLWWFVPPAGGEPVAVANPAPGSATAPSDAAITLMFDHPVSKVLGATRPTLSPSVPGTWSRPSPNRLVFTPSGFGFGPGTSVTVGFDRPVAVASAPAAGAPAASAPAAGPTKAVTTTAATSAYTFEVAPGSLGRLTQLLAQLHYLPLRFVPAAGVAVPTTVSQEIATISTPLQGTFSWRWSTVPAALAAQWTPSTYDNVLVKGALMSFEANRPTYTYDGYALDTETVSQMADASTWGALIKAAAADQLDPSPYSYVYVTKALPETLTVWENGADVLTALTNTGIPQTPTVDGTFPIFARFTVGYMNGTNPDGTTYHDLVRWINYFNGGNAVHGFVRASYGYPQSLGCVELPIATAQTVFGDLADGDLVTVAG